MYLRYLSLYETATHFYIVGCDGSKSRYHLLKIDRTEPNSLRIGESDNEYSKADIQELLATITEGSSSHDRTKGLTERCSCAFGLLGAVRFTEGYYIMLITKARIVASFGYHHVYKIEEVSMLYVPTNSLPQSSDEQRYVKIFQLRIIYSLDLTTNFYFSYKYKLSQTLQENCCSSINNASHLSGKKFVWNRFLLESLRSSHVSEKWLVEIVHGYVGQQIIELPCSRVSLTVIGRRSSVYAGTRYLKRGANRQGDVANDVETEQILWDISSSPDFRYGKFSAFVQRRGSVPLLWSQDPSTRGVVGKPLISIDINEPNAQTAAGHFRELRRKYESPIIVMNLVKRREKRPHEAILHDQFLKAVKYLNQFLPKSERILYLSFDVARCNKTGNVMSKLEEIGIKAVLRHGWFQTFPALYCHTVRTSKLLADYVPFKCQNGRYLLQKGVSRTNCVDCLDRTNVVQFGIGKVALGMQLYSMGFCGEPVLSLSSEVCRIFEDLMDEHGDTLALQYAGSQLVHSIKTYKKTAAFQERSRDVIQTLSRYYSNTFGDYDKSDAINLFLGIYRPGTKSLPQLWELGTDYYLHFPNTMSSHADYCAWFCEPNDSESLKEASENSFIIDRSLNLYDEEFSDYYCLWEVTNFDDLIREQKDLQKSVTVDGVQQTVAQNYSFAKLWKSVSAIFGNRFSCIFY
uniref:SAC domain-containing protein n=1 Tax=Syphacia muris TaxID=451379 RepID=A0A0N5AK70_9BILA